MAAVEYVSVSSQVDIETADLAREQQELDNMPEEELQELADIYVSRGLDKKLVHEVAVQLTAHNALEAHARDELGINEITQANPLQAALASGAAFLVGGVLPLLVSLFMPLDNMVIYQYVFAILFLVILGTLSALTGGSKVINSIFRITLWGSLAMGVTAYVGSLF